LTLPSGQRIPIPKIVAYYQAAPAIIASPTGDRVLLLWNAATLECDHAKTIPGRYKMALIRTSDARITPLGEGVGAAFGSFAPDGTLYIQQDRRVFGFGSAAPLPDGVLLVPPVEHEPYCGF
jgi:hypothetical protein